MKPTLLPRMTGRLTYKTAQNKISFRRPEATHVGNITKVFATELKPCDWFKTRVAAEAKAAGQEIA
jgi:hypothetical protein